MAGVGLMPRRKKGDETTAMHGIPVRLSKDSVHILRRLSGFMDKPMSDVGSLLIIQAGRPLLQKLMAEEQDRLKKEAN